MIAFAAALLLAAAPPPGPPSKHPHTPAVPLPPEGQVADPPDAVLPLLFSSADYPPEALSARKQGIVMYGLWIGADGRVRNCYVLRSSGSPILDSTTCRLLTERARFRPARDARRRRVDDVYVGRVKWLLPVPDEMPSSFPSRATANIPSLFSKDDYPRAALKARQHGTTAYHVSIDAEGSVTECTIVQSSGSAELDETTCRIISERARFNPARDSKGRAVPDYYSGRAHWVIP